MKLAVKILPIGIAMALVGSFGVLMIAPVAPHLLGAGYASTGKITRILAALPLLYAFFYLAADVLVSSHHTGLRTLLQCLMPLVNIALCAALVPPLGAVGAAIASLLSYSMIAAAAWVLALVVSARARRLGIRDVRAAGTA